MATIDSAIDKEGIDPVLSQVYAPNSKVSDLHSITSHNLFFDSTKNKIYDIEDETGKHWIGQGKQKIKTERGIVTFKELTENDKILEYV